MAKLTEQKSEEECTCTLLEGKRSLHCRSLHKTDGSTQLVQEAAEEFTEAMAHDVDSRRFRVIETGKANTSSLGAETALRMACPDSHCIPAWTIDLRAKEQHAREFIIPVLTGVRHARLADLSGARDYLGHQCLITSPNRLPHQRSSLTRPAPYRHH